MLRLTVQVMLLLAFAAPGFAQQTAAPPPRSTAPAGPTLPLSMDQAVTMALETNLGLKADRLNVGVATESLSAARAAFRPLLQGNFGRNTTNQPPSSFTDLGATVVANGSMNVSATLSQNVAFYGGTYSVLWAGNRGTTTANLSAF